MKRISWIFAIVLLGTHAMNAEEKMDMPLIIAHRGASVAAPENTMAAIKAATEAGADWVEWDTRATSDGRLLLQHDETLERFTGKKVAVAGLTFEEAQAYDVGSWFAKKFAGEKMPGLKEAIEASLPGVMPLIERKAGSAEQHFDVLHGMGVLDQVVVQAFDWKFLRDLRKLAPELRLGALGSKAIKEKQFAEIFKLKPEYVGWGSKDLKLSDIERFQSEGIKVAVWTVDDPQEVRKFVLWGVDAIITNDPASTRKVVEAMGN